MSTQINPQIDLAIDKSGTPDPVVAGEQLTYQLLVTNEGPSNATGVTVVDTLPAGVSFVTGTASQGTVAASQGVVTASLGNLAVGAQATVTLTVAVSPSARGVLLNEANVTGNETETDLTNNDGPGLDANQHADRPGHRQDRLAGFGHSGSAADVHVGGDQQRSFRRQRRASRGHVAGRSHVCVRHFQPGNASAVPEAP